MQTWRVLPDLDDARRGRLVGPLTDVCCALGRSGVTPEGEKREGDGKTPAGRYPLRRVFYRPDRVPEPVTQLSATALTPQMGWCDDPDSAQYNQFVQLPFNGGHEKLWRNDCLYDLVLVIGHNDDPPRPGGGSAIFVHVAKEGFKPTEGCVALKAPSLVSLLRLAKPTDQIQIG